MTISCKTNGQTLMWSGWNSTITKDDLPAQKIGYLANIGDPPTQHDVVNETTQRNITLAEECKEDYIATTYDLAIASQLPSCRTLCNPSTTKSLFALGHSILCSASVVGYLMDGSGAALF